MRKEIRDLLESATFTFLIMDIIIEIKIAFGLDFWQTLFVLLLFVNIFLIIYKKVLNRR